MSEVLKEHNYKTLFFSAARRNAVNWEKITQRTGIEHYISKEDFLKQQTISQEGSWGVFDKPFLEFFAGKILKKTKKPFFAIGFTNNPHAPYDIPKWAQEKYKDIPSKALRAAFYVDASIHSFFKVARQQPWYKNTLFIITGDHTNNAGGYLMPRNKSIIGKYRVPFIIFSPKEHQWPKDINTSLITQHTDILPTVLFQLGLYKKIPHFLGRPVLATSDSLKDRAVYFSGDDCFLIEDEYIYRYGMFGQHSLFIRDKEGLGLEIKDPHLLQKHKKTAEAYIQYFQNGLLDKTLFLNFNSHYKKFFLKNEKRELAVE